MLYSYAFIIHHHRNQAIYVFERDSMDYTEALSTVYYKLKEKDQKMGDAFIHTFDAVKEFVDTEFTDFTVVDEIPNNVLYVYVLLCTHSRINTYKIISRPVTIDDFDVYGGKIVMTTRI